MLKRNLSIDLIKIIAMFGVLLLHTAMRYNDGHFSIAWIMYECGVVAIPLFFMVSGYLLMDRTDINFQYIKNKIYGILKFVFIIVTFYTLFAVAIHPQRLSVGLLFNNYFGWFCQRGVCGVFWYFGAIIILYLFLPLIKRLYKKNTKMLLCVLLTCECLVFLLNTEFVWGGEIAVCQTFRLYNWLFYFCLGAFLKNKSFKPEIPVLLLSVCLYLSIRWLTYNWMDSQNCEYVYCSLPVILLVSLLFLRAKNTNIINNNAKVVITALSRLFLPVYSLHFFVIYYSKAHYISEWPSFEGYEAFIYFIMISSITVCLSFFIMKINIIGKLFKI